jgi:hypothetical protein
VIGVFAATVIAAAGVKLKLETPTGIAVLVALVV